MYSAPIPFDILWFSHCREKKSVILKEIEIEKKNRRLRNKLFQYFLQNFRGALRNSGKRYDSFLVNVN